MSTVAVADAVAVATTDTNEGRHSDTPSSPQSVACRRFLPVAGVGDVFLSSSIFQQVNPEHSNGDTTTTPPHNNNNNNNNNITSIDGLVLEKHMEKEDVPTNQYFGCESHSESNSRDAKERILNDFPMSNYCNWELIGTIKSCPEDFVVREIGGISYQNKSNVNDEKHPRVEEQVADLKPSTSTPCATRTPNSTQKMDFNSKKEDDIISSTSTSTNTSSSNIEPSSSQQGTKDHNIKENVHEIKNNNGKRKRVHSTIVTDTLPQLSSSYPQKSYQTAPSADRAIELILNQCIEEFWSDLSVEQDDAMPCTHTQSKSCFAVMHALHEEAINSIPIGNTTNPTNQSSKVSSLPSTSMSIKNIDSNNEDDHANNTTKIEEKKDSNDYVVIPPISDNTLISWDESKASSTSNGQVDASKNNRSTFHNAMKSMFPLLKSTTLRKEQMKDGGLQKLMDGSRNRRTLTSIEGMTKYATSSKGIDFNLGELRYMIVEIDTTFHDLIPYLVSPRQDLSNLYEFQKKGPPPPSLSSSPPSTTRSHHHGGRKRRRHDSRNRTRSQNSDNTSEDGENSTHYETLLHLHPDISKESRRNIHHLIQQKHRSFVTSTKSNITLLIPSSPATEDAITTTAIVVGWSPQSSFQRKRNKNKRDSNNLSSINKEGADSIQSDYNVLCVMKKTRQEHLVAIRHLASAFKCRQSDIGLAGIKDMYAITYQFCTIRSTSLDQAYAANLYLQRRGIEVGQFSKVDFLLNQGDLKGNHFKVVIRGMQRINYEAISDVTTGANEGTIDSSNPTMADILQSDKRLITERIEQLKRHGMINFFGEQRVGLAGGVKKVGVQSYDIGRAMLKGKFSDVIDLLMTGRSICGNNSSHTESDEMRKMRQVWKETGGDIDKSLASFGRRGKSSMTREWTVLQGLKRYGKNNPIAAIRCLPYNIRMLWVNAYQSFVWNTMVTERVKHGLTPIIGDLYINNEDDDVCVVTDPSTVHFHQIVLPLPGYNIMYPKNEIGELYGELLSNQGIEFKDPKSCEEPECTVKGVYRKLVIIPTGVVWNNLTKGGETLKDIEVMFSLPSGSYATIMLRELMMTKYKV